MAELRRILMLTKTDATGPASRVRHYQYLPRFERAGVEVEVRPLFDRRYFDILHRPASPRREAARAVYAAGRFVRRLADLRDAGRFDLVVVENQLFPYEQGALEAMLARAKVPFTIEFDDAIWVTPLHRHKLGRTLPLAAGVVVGNRFLAAFAERYASRVAVIPTTIELARHRHLKRHRQAGRPVVGWIGLPSNLRYLEAIGPALRRAAARIDFSLLVCSSRPPDLPGLRVEFEPWTEEGEIETVLRFDAGLMPLPDSEYERGKCGYKALQYMACGVPPLVSPVGVNAEIVRHDGNGLLAEGEAAWADGLVRLLSDARARTRLGQQARRTVEEGYSAAGWFPRLLDFYRELAGRSPAGR